MIFYKSEIIYMYLETIYQLGVINKLIINVPFRYIYIYIYSDHLMKYAINI